MKSIKQFFIFFTEFLLFCLIPWIGSLLFIPAILETLRDEFKVPLPDLEKYSGGYLSILILIVCALILPVLIELIRTYLLGHPDTETRNHAKLMKEKAGMSFMTGFGTQFIFFFVIWFLSGSGAPNVLFYILFDIFWIINIVSLTCIAVKRNQL